LLDRVWVEAVVFLMTEVMVALLLLLEVVELVVNFVVV